MTKWHIDPVGPCQWMLRWDDSDVFAQYLPVLDDGLARHPPELLLEPVFGYQSVLLIFRQPVSVESIHEWLRSLPSSVEEPKQATSIRQVDCTYDGPDLKNLARDKSCSVEEIIRRHSAPVYTVHCIGFSPGFPYLGPLDPFLWAPRKSNPRKHIQPGAVAIGGIHTGMYSIASPGGWHWIGNTPLKLFDGKAATQPSPHPDEIFTFKPGDRIQFVPAS